jgi:hypothetical protein
MKEQSIKKASFEVLTKVNIFFVFINLKIKFFITFAETFFATK